MAVRGTTRPAAFVRAVAVEAAHAVVPAGRARALAEDESSRVSSHAARSRRDDPTSRGRVRSLLPHAGLLVGPVHGARRRARAGRASDGMVALLHRSCVGDRVEHGTRAVQQPSQRVGPRIVRGLVGPVLAELLPASGSDVVVMGGSVRVVRRVPRRPIRGDVRVAVGAHDLRLRRVRGVLAVLGRAHGRAHALDLRRRLEREVRRLMPPRFRDCACGHRGAQHHEDGSCARCACPRFHRKTVVFASPAVGSIVPGRRTGKHHPTRDTPA